ncbi:MAG: hypothetical protein ACREBI_10860 [Nitrosotalea sp.]
MRLGLYFLAVSSVLLLSTGVSFAQSPAAPSPILGVYAQIVVHDSTGNLVSYLETDRVKIVDPETFSQLINSNINLFQRSLTSVGGHEIEILKVNDSIVHASPTIVSLNLVSETTPNGKQNFVFADHDGYPVVPGDRVTTYWTIIRQAS